METDLNNDICWVVVCADTLCKIEKWKIIKETEKTYVVTPDVDKWWQTEYHVNKSTMQFSSYVRKLCINYDDAVAFRKECLQTKLVVNTEKIKKLKLYNIELESELKKLEVEDAKLD